MFDSSRSIAIRSKYPHIRYPEVHMLAKSTDQKLIGQKNEEKHGKRSRAGARIEVMSRRSKTSTDTVSRSTKRRLGY